ncbi:MAG: short chain dehydrogenase [Coxiella sp. RIFCSPHIGHO2_12_FULL_42_15]|nr:MAG: short chain dehydrogenase [Coxiella sp. RIFCSPHIGHO2_12_FULL_42_15]
MQSLAKKTIVVTGASRGIGSAIAVRCGQAGANVVILAKTSDPHPKLMGTIHSVADEIRSAGGNALPLQIDLRDSEALQRAIMQAAETFGGIDALINNAGVLNLTNTLNTPMKRFDLMTGVNARATFCASQACIPFLQKAKNPHIINVSPPLNMDKKWFKHHLPYTISKYGMSMCTLGMSAEFAQEGIAVNSLWPQTTIATTAVEVHFPQEVYQGSRTPKIMADAAYQLLLMNSKQCTGNFFTDESLLRQLGQTDFSQYAVNKNAKLVMDGFLE